MHRIVGFLASIVLFVALCATCCACCVTNIVKPPSGPELAKMEGASTVALVHTYQGKTSPFCTGVWVSNDTILTANHCVNALVDELNEENNMKILQDLLNSSSVPDVMPKLSDVNPMGLTVQYIMQGESTGVEEEPSAIHISTAFALYGKKDLALLRVSNPRSIPTHGIAILADESPAQGEAVSVMGHPIGLYWTYMTGTVAAYRDNLEGVGIDDFTGPFMQLEIPVYHGHSGGGAFNDRGELIGIASFILRTPDTAMFIHLDTIRAVLVGNHIIAAKLNLNPFAPDPTLE